MIPSTASLYDMHFFKLGHLDSLHTLVYTLSDAKNLCKKKTLFADHWVTRFLHFVVFNVFFGHLPAGLVVTPYILRLYL